MGAWGCGPFENDDAADWLGELEDLDPASLEQTLRSVLVNGYVEVTAASQAVAAAETTAAMIGAPKPGLPSEVRAWVRENNSSSAPVELAKQAVRRVLDASELVELWRDAGPDYEKWRAELDDLLRRLTGNKGS